MIPANIEASMFAILTGLINFCNFFLAKQLGNFINIFVGVTNDDLSDLWILFAIMTGCALIPLLFVWLIPKRKEVFLVQQVNEFVEKYPLYQTEGEDSDDSIDKDGLIDALMKLDPIVAKQMGIYETYKEEIGIDFEHPALSEI